MRELTALLALLIGTATVTPRLATTSITVTPGAVVALPEPAGDGRHTMATAAGGRRAAADTSTFNLGQPDLHPMPCRARTISWSMVQLWLPRTR